MMRSGIGQEKQGDLGDLKTNTKAELIDLLARQEKLLANRRFLNSLKDKGAKVESFANKLRKAIEEREDVDRTMQLFERMDLGQERTVGEVSERTSSQNECSKDESTCITTANSTIDSGISNVHKKELSPAGNVIQEMKGKFKPNRYLRSTAIPDDLPRPMMGPSPMEGQSSKVRPGEPQLSSALQPSLRNQEAQVVEFEESASLLEHQKKAAEGLVARQAAERLMERLNIKMGDFIPDVQHESYRGQTADSDDESEDEEDEEDEDDTDDQCNEIED